MITKVFLPTLPYGTHRVDIWYVHTYIPYLPTSLPTAQTSFPFLTRTPPFFLFFPVVLSLSCLASKISFYHTDIPFHFISLIISLGTSTLVFTPLFAFS